MLVHMGNTRLRCLTDVSHMSHEKLTLGVKVRNFAIVAVALLASAMSVPSLASIPAPGTHGVSKIWPAIRATAINFSPFSFDAHIVALSPDGSGGVWFGLGETLEHIDRFGAMHNYDTRQSWLWQISGLARDPAGRLWFSLGQSGRIGTFDNHGALQTRIVVARKFFPDIHQIIFGGDGTLWFQDFGRLAVGERTPNGRLREMPLPDGGTPSAIARCDHKLWIATSGRAYDAIYTVTGNLRSLHRVAMLRRPGRISIACSLAGNLWFAHVPSQDNTTSSGYIDARGVVHAYGVGLQSGTVHRGGDGSIWFAGFRASSPREWTSARLVLIRLAPKHDHAWTLPVPFDAFDDSLTSSGGAVWLSCNNPDSVLKVTFEP